jgi:hypothetical protein
MIGVLNMKSAHIPSLAILPLPLFTLVFKMMCKHRYDRHVYYYRPKIEMPIEKGRVNDNIGFKFGDPAFYAELPVPMVHERVRHLLPKLYRSHEKSLSRPYVSKMTRKTSVRHLSVIQLQHASGGELQFQSMGREDIEIDDSTEGLKGMYKFNDDEEEIDLGDAAQASTSSNERLDCDQKSAAMTSKKKKKNPLKRLGRKLKLPFIRKKNKAGPKKGESPYASHFPLVDTTEVIVEEEEEEEEETCLDYQVLPFQFQMTNGYDYFTDQGSTISSICNQNESQINKVFTGNDPE